MIVAIYVSSRRDEWGDWVVRVRHDGKLRPDAYYHTDDRAEALSTAAAMRHEARNKGHTIEGSK